MRSSRSPLATLIAAITLLPAAISPVGAINDASLSPSQQEPEAQSVLVNDPAVAVASHDDKAIKIPTNQSETVVVITSTENEKRDTKSKPKPKPKKKKPPKTKGGGNHTDDDDDDDDDSGVGRGITLPTSLAIGIVLLVGALQF